jgi:hypothetical protein
MKSKIDKNIDKSYDLFIVKRNDGKVIRLARLFDIIEKKADRIEIELRGLEEQDLINPDWQADKIIWWSPTNPLWYEATVDDEVAKTNYELVKQRICTLPDLTEQSVVGTFMIAHYGGDKFTVVDGNFRKVR